MNQNDDSAQDYLNSPGRFGNSYAPAIIPNNNNNNNTNYHVKISNPNNTVLPDTYQFYLPLPNDTIYRVTYTKLHSSEIAKLLNNGVDISSIPDSHFFYHQRVQGLICQQIHQRVEQHSIQTFNTIPNSQIDRTPPNPQVHSNNNIYNNMDP
ncbi:hypothetical protein RclHR1_01050001 [Rhizophagus clarus]|uniref:Uncharacterized protein n=1 Tax=Rhizophagus clarus TaxID=94130 RepID=A0A2Z6Q212_9GLOM|nr:hypothetical protein RclHR1_01050001 [Rhizophagus clarus]GES73889.1 hypothetical protein GLOIN_2v1482137 [Rhizophagus clarus]